VTEVLGGKFVSVLFCPIYPARKALQCSVIFEVAGGEENSKSGQDLHRGADKSLARPDWKNNLKVTIFRPTRWSLLPRRPGWTDKVLIFFLS